MPLLDFTPAAPPAPIDVLQAGHDAEAAATAAGLDAMVACTSGVWDYYWGDAAKDPGLTCNKIAMLTQTDFAIMRQTVIYLTTIAPLIPGFSAKYGETLAKLSGYAAGWDVTFDPTTGAATAIPPHEVLA